MTDILGLQVDEIPEGYIPIGCYALIECLDDEGDRTYVVRHAGMDSLRRYGALNVLIDQERDTWLNGFEPLEPPT